ncbi:MAG: hypothetical protein IPJ00_07900 [Saprospirales bacterium]|nr:hypothetical protein [Saprospirales bacterium]MBK7336085.1 hypothetical protein [Saprospirales bacterium]
MHGNSKKNPNPHHLYGIFEEKTAEVFKYGITDDPLSKDGLPARTRKQLTILNLAAGFLKFIARVLLSGIPGREEAERIEREYIDDYFKKHGRKPPGNLK